MTIVSHYDGCVPLWRLCTMMTAVCHYDDCVPLWRQCVIMTTVYHDDGSESLWRKWVMMTAVSHCDGGEHPARQVKMATACVRSGSMVGNSPSKQNISDQKSRLKKIKEKNSQFTYFFTRNDSVIYTYFAGLGIHNQSRKKRANSKADHRGVLI